MSDLDMVDLRVRLNMPTESFKSLIETFEMIESMNLIDSNRTPTDDLDEKKSFWCWLACDLGFMIPSEYRNLFSGKCYNADAGRAGLIKFVMWKYNKSRSIAPRGMSEKACYDFLNVADQFAGKTKFTADDIYGMYANVERDNNDFLDFCYFLEFYIMVDQIEYKDALSSEFLKRISETLGIE